MIEIENLSIKFDKEILSNVSLECKKGEIVSITGPSGSGKTSFIRFVMGEVSYQDGIVYYNNEVINDDNRDDFLFNVVCYIDQFSSYYPNMSIYDHFKFYAKLYKIKVKRKDMKEYLSKVKLEKISLWKSPSKLSTGERKRFLIALALMLKKEIIIMDEPTASLDQNNISIILDIIKELSENGTTFLISTHNREVIDICDVLYEIKDTKLIKKVNIEKENLISNKEYKKPRRINYSRYKNIRLRILFAFIVLLGGITISYVSHILSQTIVYKDALNEDVPTYKNDKIYVGKMTDEKNLTYGDPWYQPVLGIWDIMNESDFNKILEIDGVEEIRRQLIVEANSIVRNSSNEPKVDTKPLYIYKNGELIKTDNIKHEKDGEFSNKTIYAVGYYPDEIQVDGYNADSVYINDILYEMIEMDDISDIEIEYDAYFAYKYKYETITWHDQDPDTEDTQTTYMLSVYGSTNKMRIPIDGMITRTKYHDLRFYNDTAIVYVPIDKLKEIIKNNEGLKNRDVVIEDETFDFMTKTCVVICEEGRDEEVMIAINELDGGYYAEAPYYTQKEMISMLDMQNTSSLSLAVIFSLLLIGCESLLISYYVRLRKTEIILLNRNGLSKKISRYLGQDDYKMGIVWIILSIGCWYMAFLFTPIKEYASVELHLIAWSAITVVFTVMLVAIKRMLVHRLRKKMIA